MIKNFQSQSQSLMLMKKDQFQVADMAALSLLKLADLNAYENALSVDYHKWYRNQLKMMKF